MMSNDDTNATWCRLSEPSVARSLGLSLHRELYNVKYGCRSVAYLKVSGWDSDETCVYRLSARRIHCCRVGPHRTCGSAARAGSGISASAQVRGGVGQAEYWPYG